MPLPAAVGRGPLGHPGAQREPAVEGRARGRGPLDPSRRGRRAGDGRTRNSDRARPSSVEWAAALMTSRPCRARTPATRLNVPGRSSHMTVILSSDASMSRPPSASRRSCSGVGNRSAAAGACSPRSSTWSTRSTSRPTSSAFHAPCRRARRERVGLGERGEQVEASLVPTAAATRSMIGRGRRGHAGWRPRRAAGGAHEDGDRLGVAGGSSPSGRRCARRTPRRPRCGRPAALAEVVEQGGGHEQIGSLDLRARPAAWATALQEMPVDGEAVVGVALGARPHVCPLRQDPGPDATLVERFDHATAPRPAEQQGDEQRPNVRRSTVPPAPGVGQRSARGCRVDRRPVLGGGRGGAEDQDGIRRPSRRGRPGAARRRRSCRSGGDPYPPPADRPSGPRSAGSDPAPCVVARPGDHARRRRRPRASARRRRRGRGRSPPRPGPGG